MSTARRHRLLDEPRLPGPRGGVDLAWSSRPDRLLNEKLDIYVDGELQKRAVHQLA